MNSAINNKPSLNQSPTIQVKLSPIDMLLLDLYQHASEETRRKIDQILNKAKQPS